MSQVINNIIPWSEPRYPEFKLYSERLKSFISLKWSTNLHQKPKKLANAGFFYTGINDRVICYFCGGGLHKWDIDDDPFREHEKHFSRCSYLRLFKNNDVTTTRFSKASNIINSDFPCKLCYLDEANILFMPCNHLFACICCTSCLTYCSVCRCKINNLIKVYIA